MDPEDTSEVTAAPQRGLRPNPDVLARRAGDETVLVQVRTSRIYELNRTAAAFWNLLQAGRTKEEIESQLAREFDVDRRSLTAEVEGLIGVLAAEDLVREG
jgi:hypothetical protein